MVFIPCVRLETLELCVAQWITPTPERSQHLHNVCSNKANLFNYYIVGGGGKWRNYAEEIQCLQIPMNREIRDVSRRPSGTQNLPAPQIADSDTDLCQIPFRIYIWFDIFSNKMENPGEKKWKKMMMMKNVKHNFESS